MSLYKPFGIFPGQVVDQKQLEKEYNEAKKIIKNTTSWQWMSDKSSGLEYAKLAKGGAGVIVEQRQRSGYINAGGGKNYDATNIDYGELALDAPINPWYIPYLRGWKEVWDGELNLNWTSSHSELVLVGYSFFAYRLGTWGEGTKAPGIPESSEDVGSIAGHDTGQWFFGKDTQPRIKFGVRIDGSVVEGSGCGTNNATQAPEMIWGSGSRQKAIVSSSTSVHMLGAGSHEVAPVAGQGPANKTDKDNYYKTDAIKTNYSDDSDNSPNNGVVVVNARIHTIRFPRGRMLGS